VPAGADFRGAGFVHQADAAKEKLQPKGLVLSRSSDPTSSCSRRRSPRRARLIWPWAPALPNLGPHWPRLACGRQGAGCDSYHIRRKGAVVPQLVCLRPPGVIVPPSGSDRRLPRVFRSEERRGGRSLMTPCQGGISTYRAGQSHRTVELTRSRYGRGMRATGARSLRDKKNMC